jgi:predicted dehydrogenase/threonine dehydrogenase-like Zn-dependent dehydrogenase
MRQILQHLGNGQSAIADVPCPAITPGNVLIQSVASLISAGTERMLVDFGRASLLDKARQHPDKVMQALEKVCTDGVLATIEAVRSKLDQPIAMGYCNVGRVIERGAGVDSIAVGERVVSNGKHAEIVVVPKNLCARIPDFVDDDSAAFTVVGAIALEGVRLAQPTLGEAVAVIGLGLIGLMTVQILRANGCRVLGLDLNASRLRLARQFGAEVVNVSRGQDPLAAAKEFSRGRGMDAVIVTASTTSSEPMHQAALMCRKRGRIVLVGVTGLKLSRADFYEKELSLQVSCSYGPGRYDPAYEEGGQDYPVGFVRWTEQRNFEAVLDLMAAGRLDVKPFITHRFHINEALRAYDLLASSESSLGILIRYPAYGHTQPSELLRRTLDLGKATGILPALPVLGFIGAGNYAGRVLIGAFEKAGASLQTLVTQGGVSAAHFGRKYGFRQASTDSRSVFDDSEVNAVVVATRHDSHAQLVVEGLAAGKHVFAEKPLCLNVAELETIKAAYDGACVGVSFVRDRFGYTGYRADSAPADPMRTPLLMVGFNRRFAPLVVKMKSLLATVSAPKTFVMMVNAGAIPADHWTQDPIVGGGRLLGEACHFIDLLRHLAGVPIAAFDVAALMEANGPTRPENATIMLRFADGSMGTIHYLANGHKGIPKERLEVFCAGRVLQLDNFRSLRGYGWPGFSRMRLWLQDKGQAACAKAFVQAVRDGAPAPIPVEELFEVSRLSIQIAEKR